MGEISARMQAWLRNQFGRPHGVPGELAGLIMAHRPSNRERAFWTLDRLEIAPQHRVLEVGCGPGVAIERATALAPSGFVLGIDHSEVMVRQARRRNAAAIREGRVEIRRASVESLARVEETFDRIFAINTIGFWHDRVNRLRELRERLAPGGKLALTFQPRGACSDEDALRDAEAKLVAMAEEAGCARVRSERLVSKPAAVCVLAERSQAMEL